MAEHRPTPSDAPAGVRAWIRRHAIDLTPIRTSADFRRLFFGTAVSDLGDELVAVAVPYQVYLLTHSTLAVGMLGLCQLVPVFVFPIVGGAAADAMERRRLVIRVHIGLAILSALMAANALQHRPMVWPLYVFATLSAGLYTFKRPAVSTWPARLLPAELLPSGFAIEAALGTAAHMTGPAIAGVLLAVIKPSGVFTLDVVSFLVVIASVARMRPSPPEGDAPGVSVAAIREGFRLVRSRQEIQGVFAADLNAMIFGFPTALFPAFAERLGGGPRMLGLLYAAPAVGAFLATLASGGAKHVVHQGRVILGSNVVWGLGIVAFGLSRDPWLALPTLAIAGAGDMVSGIFRMAILQQSVDDRIRGRLDGIAMAVWATGPSLGEVESGVVASLVSVPFAIVSGGIATIAGAGIVGAALPKFWRYRAPAAAPEAAG